MNISLKTYHLYLKYGSECLWTIDTRVSRPKDTSSETDKEFIILEDLENKLKMISIKKYNTKITLMINREIDELKLKVSEEVFTLMKGTKNL